MVMAPIQEIWLLWVTEIDLVIKTDQFQSNR